MNIKKKTIRQVTDETLIDMYWLQNISMQAIAEYFGYANQASIVKEFKRRGFAYRDYREAGMIVAKRSGFPLSQPKRREKHPMWRGGRFTRKDGYVVVYAPDWYIERHNDNLDRGCYVFEHRLVWEQANGKMLKKNEQVHHLNGIRNDNRPENLAIVNNNNHERRTFLKILQKRIRELEQLHMPI